MNDVPAAEPSAPEAAPKSPRRGLVRAVKWTVLAITLVGVGFQCRSAYREFQADAGGVAVDLRWWLAGAGLYLVGWTLQSTPWQLTLVRFGGPAASWRTLAVYLAGHLGKYVPGKAMVFAIRGSLLAPEAPLAAALVGTLYETLVTMSAGAAVGAVALFVWFPETTLAVRLGAAGVAAALFVALTPAVFGRAVGFGLRKIRQDRFLGPGPTPSRLAAAFVGAAAAWACIAAGYACTVRAVVSGAELPALLTLGLAAAPLAVVGGFLSMIPGHLGVREFVLVALAAPVLDSHAKALIAAGLFRVTTLAVEVPVGLACYMLCANKDRGERGA